jgi:hypothetical protein
MKVPCPRCAREVPAADLNLNIGWGKCVACQELFPLADVVPGFPALGPRPAELVPRPPQARAFALRTEEVLAVNVPAEGMRVGTLGLLFFTAMWVGFIAFWTAGALGFLGDPRGRGGHQGFAFFSIPFWLVGLFMLGAVAWQLWGTKAIRLDPEGMMLQQRCLVWSWSRWVARERIQLARSYMPQVQRGSGPPPLGVEIVYRSGSFVLPVDSAEERHWLIAEINDFLRALAAEPASAAHPERETRFANLDALRRRLDGRDEGR